MTDATKPVRKPGDLVECACDGCDKLFILEVKAMMRTYCRPRCRQMAAEARKMARDPAFRHMTRLRAKTDAAGGTAADGGLVCGTRSLATRRVVDVRNPPQDDARFW